MKIIIVGAGIGGLTLGNLLHQSDPSLDFQIFERDAEAHSRSQGYSFTMKEPGGLSAMRRLDLFDEILRLGHVVVNFPFVTQAGQPLLNLRDQSDPPRTLRVPRDQLRDLLLCAIHDRVHFKAPCRGFAEREGKPVVQLADGREESADLVVGGDGVNSVIRQQMVGDRPHYLGITSIAAAVTPAVEHPLLADGSFIMIGAGAAIFVLNESGATAWSLSLPAQIDEFETVPKPVLKQRAVDVTRTWSSPVPEIVSRTDPAALAITRGYDKDPLLFARRGPVVLLGDAAHTMSPFRGEGANMAMLDALSLADRLAAPPSTGLEDILAGYEKEMLARSRKAILESRNAALEIHTRNPVRQIFRNATWRVVNRILPLVQKR